MSVYTAVLRRHWLGKGKGRRTSLKLYSKSGELIRDHSGPIANRIAGALRFKGINVIDL